MDISLILSVIALVLMLPVGVVSILLTPRLVSYLEKRKLIKTRKTKQQALETYNRIKAFREGKRDRYPFYMLLVSVAVICAAIACTILIVFVLVEPEFFEAVLYLLVAFLFSIWSVLLLLVVHETARQLDRFQDYKKEFEERWGPLDD
jgi:cation transport ATPase